MIKELEKLALAWGNTTCTLSSTGTARRFYISAGYSEDETKVGMFGTKIHAMRKAQ